MRIYEIIKSSVRELLSRYFPNNSLSEFLPDASFQRDPRYAKIAQMLKIQQNELAEKRKKASILEEQLAQQSETIRKLSAQEQEARRKLEEAIDRNSEYASQILALRESYQRQASLLKESLRNAQRISLENLANTLIGARRNEFVVAVGIDNGILAVSPGVVKKLSMGSQEEILGRNIYSFVTPQKEYEIKKIIKERIGKILSGKEEQPDFNYIIFEDVEITNPDNRAAYKTDIYVSPQFIRNSLGKNQYIGTIIVERPLMDQVEPRFYERIVQYLRNRKRKKDEQEMLRPTIEIQKELQRILSKRTQNPGPQT